jgi:predicted small lipoprotein YifL
MKVLLALFALPILCLTGCGSKEPAPDPAAVAEQASATPPPEPPGSTPDNPSGAANPELRGG